MTLERIREIADIALFNEERIREIKGFLKSVYNYGVSVIESIPDSTMYRILRDAHNEVGAFVICTRDGKTYLNVEEYSAETNSVEDGEKILVNEDYLAINYFDVTIGICNKPDIVRFSCDICKIDPTYVYLKALANKDFLNQVFAEYLEFSMGSLTEGFISFGINVEWFN